MTSSVLTTALFGVAAVCGLALYAELPRAGQG